MAGIRFVGVLRLLEHIRVIVVVVRFEIVRGHAHTDLLTLT